MAGTSQSLRVSYGTFTCTVQGFDDNLGVMKDVALFFRDLVAGEPGFATHAAVDPAAFAERASGRLPEGGRGSMADGAFVFAPGDDDAEHGALDGPDAIDAAIERLSAETARRAEAEGADEEADEADADIAVEDATDEETGQAAQEVGAAEVEAAEASPEDDAADEDGAVAEADEPLEMAASEDGGDGHAEEETAADALEYAVLDAEAGSDDDAPAEERADEAPATAGESAGESWDEEPVVVEDASAEGWMEEPVEASDDALPLPADASGEDAAEEIDAAEEDAEAAGPGPAEAGDAGLKGADDASEPATVAETESAGDETAGAPVLTHGRGQGDDLAEASAEAGAPVGAHDADDDAETASDASGAGDLGGEDGWGEADDEPVLSGEAEFDGFEDGEGDPRAEEADDLPVAASEHDPTGEAQGEAEDPAAGFDPLAAMDAEEFAEDVPVPADRADLAGRDRGGNAKAMLNEMFGEADDVDEDDAPEAEDASADGWTNAADDAADEDGVGEDAEQPSGTRRAERTDDEGPSGFGAELARLLEDADVTDDSGPYLARLAEEESPAARRRRVLSEDSVPEDAVERLMHDAEDRIEAAESEGSFNAIQRLRHAVMAAEGGRPPADRDADDGDADAHPSLENDAETADRADGADDGRRMDADDDDGGEWSASPEASGAEAAAAPRPAPMVLVSAQRVDAPVADDDDDDEDGADLPPQGGTATSLAALWERRSLVSPDDRMMAAAAMIARASPQGVFTRSEVMELFSEALRGRTLPPEERMRAFGLLVRHGRIRRADRGTYALAQPEAIPAE